jgi:hypothetical protein
LKHNIAGRPMEPEKLPDIAIDGIPDSELVGCGG